MPAAGQIQDHAAARHGEDACGRTGLVGLIDVENRRRRHLPAGGKLGDEAGA